MATKEFPGNSSGNTQNENASAPGASGNTIPFGIARAHQQQKAEADDFYGIDERLRYLNAMTIASLNTQIEKLHETIVGREPGRQFPTDEEADILYKLTRSIAILQPLSAPQKSADRTLQRWNDLVRSINEEV